MDVRLYPATKKLFFVKNGVLTCTKMLPLKHQNATNETSKGHLWNIKMPPTKDQNVTYVTPKCHSWNTKMLSKH